MIDLPGISGITIAGDVGGRTELAVEPAIGEASLLRLLYWLPPGCELSFYDQYFPGTRGDPGAYVDIQRKGDWFQYHMGNHGWFQPWTTQSPELLVAWIALNLKPKPGNPGPLRKMVVEANARLPDAFVRN